MITGDYPCHRAETASWTAEGGDLSLPVMKYDRGYMFLIRDVGIEPTKKSSLIYNQSTQGTWTTPVVFLAVSAVLVGMQREVMNGDMIYPSNGIVFRQWSQR